MDGDDLNRPLGLDRDGLHETRDIPWGALALGGIGALALGLIVFNRLTDEPRDGEPFAVASIERPVEAPTESMTPATRPPQAALAAEPKAPGAAASADSVDLEHGVRVVRSGGGGAPAGALIIQVPDALAVQLAPAPDKRLVEKGPHGLLPRIGPDGARALQVYARPLAPSPKLGAEAPRLALVVGGMGISRAATDHAIEALPGAVTLAFAPYGSDVPGLAAKARSAGHELLLQVPMEPFDPAQMPGPRSLRVELGAEQNLDHLHWAMSRFAGYVGVMNYMGGKFTAQDGSLAPIERDVARRGLLWLDDGSSARSLARDGASGAGLSFVQAQANLEGTPPEGFDAALDRVEAAVRARGRAVLVASGLPGTVDRLAAFAQGLEQRGIALVPVSALADPPARPMASRAEQP